MLLMALFLRGGIYLQSPIPRILAGEVFNLDTQAIKQASANHNPGQIQPTTCFSTAPKLRMVFTFFNGWKVIKNNIS